MNDTNSLNHSERECKYHAVWIPKYRKKAVRGMAQTETPPRFTAMELHDRAAPDASRQTNKLFLESPTNPWSGILSKGT